ncbi:MAG: RIP metalloprotease RseP [Candidatus Omnitrophota bacterium]
MLTIFASIIVFGVLILIHELGHFLLARKNGVRVEKFSFGFGPRLLKKKVRDTEYILSAIPLGGYIKMAGDDPAEKRKGKPWEFMAKSCGQRAQIIAAGPILNYLLGFFFFSIVFIIGCPTLTTRVGKVLEDYPARAAGIQENDVILAVDGKKVEFWDDMAELIHQKTQAAEVVLDIKRDNEFIKIKLSPQTQEREDILGQKKKMGLIGIQPSEEMTEVKYGWAKSFYKGGQKTWVLTTMTYKALWLVLTHRMSFKESFAGPIFIFKLTGNVAKMGFIYLISLMGHLSICLALFNFLPLPVLDGGHLFFLLLEKIRRKPVNLRVQEMAAQFGLAALVTLVLFISYNDLVRVGAIEKIFQWGSKIGMKQ